MAHVTLTAQPLPDGALPTAFRIFKRGLNHTSQGPFLFDDEAARSVLAAQARDNVDVMLDLEHLSLDPKAPNYDPDARGWCKLAVRAGELWAHDVRWGADGAARLRDRRQRYVSPVVDREVGTNRVLSIYNIALCAQPATYGAQPLVAASKLGRARSTIVGARVTKETAAVFRALAKRQNVAPGVLLRRVLVELAKSPDEQADKSIELVRQALGLEPDAARAEIIDAIDQLFSLVGDVAAANPDPLADVPDAPKPRDDFKLSAAMVKALARARLPLTRQGWERLKRDAVTRSGERPAPLRSAPRPSTAHLAKCAAAVRRR